MFAPVSSMPRRHLSPYALLEGMADIVLVTRISDLRIVHANAAARSAYRYSLEEIVGIAAADLTLPEQGNESGAQLGEAAVRPLEFEALSVRKDGTVFPAWVRTHAAVIDHELVAISLIRDMTGYKRREDELARARDAAVAASELKSRFVATAAHELRTPINAIVGLTELLAGTQEEHRPRVIELLGLATQSVLELIGELLDLSKIESNEMTFSNEPLAVADIVRRAVEGLEPQAGAKNLKLRASVDQKIPGNLRGDAMRLRQVLVNLLCNAVKFTERGRIDVEARLERLTESSCRIRFSVRDTGIGIPPEQLDRIFDPFVQVDKSRSRRAQGSGLGLSICAHLVKMMNGRLDVDSEPGRGSTFWFTVDLPVQSNPADG